MIDLVAVNLYPFKEKIARPGTSLAEVVENIDIGGPAMLRSAAKNYQDVTVIADPDDYDSVVQEIKNSGDVTLSTKFKLARKAFEHTAAYDALIAEYLGRVPLPPGCSVDTPKHVYFPKQLSLTYDLKQPLRYGENPHQSAAFYTDPLPEAGSLATYSQLHGKELSYNNIGDLDGALSLLSEFTEPAAVAVKHANPCGAAVAADIYNAYTKAYESDKEAIYGGVIALNRPVDARTASEINKIFIEIVAAPEFEAEALGILAKKKNIRLLVVDTKSAARSVPFKSQNAATGYTTANYLTYKKVGGGLLAQTGDDIVANMADIVIVTEKKPSDAEIEDLLFAMAVVKHTKSNAIVLAKQKATVGVGPGQNSRISAAKIAVGVAGARAVGSVAASDAFMPFGDCVEAFAEAGVAAIIQPGGSIRDDISIDACNRYGIAMAFTGVRHFKH